MDNSKNRKIGAILSYVSIIATTLIQLLYTPLLIRKLGQSEYGLYSLINSVIGYLTILDLGFGNAIVVYTAKYRALKKYEEEKKLHGMFFIIFLIIGVIAGIGGLILYFNVNNLFGSTMTDTELHKAKIMMLILTFNLVISFSFNIYSSIINAYEKFVFQKIMSITNTLLKPILMIPLLFLGYRSIAMCVIITIVNLFVMISNYYYCTRKLNVNVKFKGFDKVIFIEIFTYSFWIFLNSIVDKANWSIDQFILGAVSGTVAVSVYSVASQLNQLFVNLSNAISGVLLPKMSQMVAKKASSRELTDEMIKVGRIQYYIIFLLITGLFLVGREFIMLWAGSEYKSSYYVALMLIIPLCFPLIQNLGLSIIQAMNKYKFRAIMTFVMALANVIISYFLAKAYGPIGSAFGTAIALIICNILIMNIYYYKEIKLDVIKFWKQIFKMTLVMIIPFLIMEVLKFFTNINGIGGILIYGSIYTLIYSISVYCLVMNNYEKSIVNKVLVKIHLLKE